MIIRAKAYPRAGLIGNPSDGYYGKTIAFTFRNFSAQVDLYETPELEILPATKDHSRFNSLDELIRDVQLHGYYGGIRLLKATIKRFHDYCRENAIDLDERNFTVRYHSTIPHGVGLAGSSAIIMACLRALMSFYGVNIPKAVQANLALEAEVKELSISAGLQDRVVQAYEGLVAMDFEKDFMKQHGHGRYEELDAKSLPPLYIAYRTDLSQCSEVVHNRLRERYNRGEPAVLKGIHQWMKLTDRFARSLADGKVDQLGGIMDANFDQRQKLCPLSEGNLRMVEAARSVGASAKFTGSGGAIVGTCADRKVLDRLKKVMKELKVKVIKPIPVAGKKRNRA